MAGPSGADYLLRCGSVPFRFATMESCWWVVSFLDVRLQDPCVPIVQAARSNPSSSQQEFRAEAARGMAALLTSFFALSGPLFLNPAGWAPLVSRAN